MDLLKKLNTPFNWFFWLYVILGVYWMKDYGIPLDELTQRHIGIENARFISGAGNTASIEKNGFFGPAFEMLCYVLEQFIYNAEPGVKILLRHCALFVFFLLAIRSFYSIALSLVKNAGNAVVATILFALNPLIFAHAHYNSKDTLFLCLVVFVFYFITRFTKTGQRKHLVLAALVLGISATVRLNALFLLLAFALSFLVFKRKDLRSQVKEIALFLVVFVAGFYLFYPYLWLHPFDSAGDLLHYTTLNPWPWNTVAAGQDILPGALPWWYLFAWMGVTIPLVHLLTCALGLGRMILNRNGFWNFENLAILFSFVLPLTYFMVFRPTLYNGWRHMQFVYAPMCLMAAYGIEHLMKTRAGSVLTGAFVLYSCVVFVRWQPYGYAYFNEVYAVMGKPRTYDQDYWGLSALPALRWIVENDKRDSIVITSFTESPMQNALFLKPDQRKRLHFSPNAGPGNYEIQIKRGRNFSTVPGSEVYHICPLKDTLIRVIKTE